ncbi:uncharacterized protein I303_103455 [Kwoniella dejecticola CBS 10117]|uniref:Uncharacterized protein n=1 Tax=Kwoniella dejecticola CBS 10117 TaxID=1296121 RepID=A0A1A6A6S8_9TREE|nr:uncharacterized protein I303_03478 [Kwoniella dejecticola CBS 10117]OBR85766.1 hypothetical protein I303_03478 [Kwoniella dejecticola CBS 10117]
MNANYQQPSQGATIFTASTNRGTLSDGTVQRLNDPELGTYFAPQDIHGDIREPRFTITLREESYGPQNQYHLNPGGATTFAEDLSKLLHTSTRTGYHQSHGNDVSSSNRSSGWVHVRPPYGYAQFGGPTHITCLSVDQVKGLREIAQALSEGTYRAT